MSFWSDWAPRKTAAQRRAESARKIKDAARRGTPMSPVVLAGRTIAETFWGKAWCDNLERYQDFAYRLDRGRSYLRSGSVIDLKIEAGKVVSTVSGSSLYKIAIEIDAVKPDAWRAIQRECAGGIASRLDLLAGRLSEPVMTRLCADRTGMFPAPSSIRFTCSCPDYATMCKHVAATMYGIGARLDSTPELLFTLRRVSADELLASALSHLPAKPSAARVLATGGLAALFGLELEPAPKTAAKSAPKAATQPAPKAVAKPAPKAVAKPALKAAANPDPKARAKPDPKARAKPALKAAAGPAPKAAAGPAPEAAAKPAPKAAAWPAKAAAKPATKAAAKSSPRAAARPAKAAAKPATRAAAKQPPKPARR